MSDDALRIRLLEAEKTIRRVEALVKLWPEQVKGYPEEAGEFFDALAPMGPTVSITVLRCADALRRTLACSCDPADPTTPRHFHEPPEETESHAIQEDRHSPD